MKVAILYSLKILVTCACLYWAFSLIEDTGALVEHFHQALHSPFWLVSGLMIAGASIFAGALRFHLLLRAQAIDASLAYVCRLSIIATLFNVASIGAAAGDAVKVFGVSRRNPNQKIQLTMIVMMDHLVGFVSGSLIFLVFAWGGGLIDSLDSGLARSLLIYATIFQLVGLLGVVLMFSSSSEKRFGRFQAKFPKLAANEHVLSVAKAVHVFQNQRKATYSALGASLAQSLMYFLSFYVALKTLGEVVPMISVLTVMPVVDAVSALPVSISGLGVREKVFEFFLVALTNVSAGAAVSASLIGYLFHVFWGAVGGVMLIFERSSKKELRAK